MSSAYAKSLVRKGRLESMKRNSPEEVKRLAQEQLDDMKQTGLMSRDGKYRQSADPVGTQHLQDLRKAARTGQLPTMGPADRVASNRAQNQTRFAEAQSMGGYGGGGGGFGGVGIAAGGVNGGPSSDGGFMGPISASQPHQGMSPFGGAGAGGGLGGQGLSGVPNYGAPRNLMGNNMLGFKPFTPANGNNANPANNSFRPPPLRRPTARPVKRRRPIVDPPAPY